MNITAEKVREMANAKEVVSYEVKMAEIEKAIEAAASNYDYSTAVCMCGTNFCTCNNDIRKIKATLKKNGFRVSYDVWSGCLDINW